MNVAPAGHAGSTDWLTIDDVEREAFAAIVGAKAFAKGYAPVPDVGDGDLPDLPGHPLGYFEHQYFLEDLVRIFSGRLQRLALARGVAIVGWVPESDRLTTLENRYGDHVTGEVRTITDADIKAMPAAQRKAFEAAVRSGKPATLPKAA